MQQSYALLGNNDNRDESRKYKKQIGSSFCMKNNKKKKRKRESKKETWKHSQTGNTVA